MTDITGAARRWEEKVSTKRILGVAPSVPVRKYTATLPYNNRRTVDESYNVEIRDGWETAFWQRIKGLVNTTLVAGQCGPPVRLFPMARETTRSGGQRSGARGRGVVGRESSVVSLESQGLRTEVHESRLTD